MGRRPYNNNYDTLDLTVETSAGVKLFVDTENGNDGDSGLTWPHALATVEEATNRLTASGRKFYSPVSLASNSEIYVKGCVKEQFTAPLGVYGVKIIGAAGGRPRHATSGGVVTDGNASAWVQSTVAENAPLLTLREQGWEIHNMLMVPESGYAAVKLRRDEDASYPDASHCVFKGVKFISPGTRVGFGIEDIGQNYNVKVQDCEFANLEYGYNPSAGGAWGGAAPGRHLWVGNRFHGNKHDIVGNFANSEFFQNRFYTPYDVTTHPNTVNLAITASAGAATDVNYVLENWFADTSGNVTIAKGYVPATGDVWANHVAGTAALIVAVPT